MIYHMEKGKSGAQTGEGHHLEITTVDFSKCVSKKNILG